jgi:hypothetical protein
MNEAATPAWNALYRQALARRLAGQPEAVQALLRLRIGEPVPEPAPTGTPAKRHRPPSPLAQLNESLRAAQAARLAPAPGEPPPDPDELASARRFRAAWDASRVLDQVERAIARQPAQAGPLNSHMLVVQSLAMMRALSTDYLRHFIVHVETLQWLEQATTVATKDAGKPGKPARRARAAKP